MLSNALDVSRILKTSFIACLSYLGPDNHTVPTFPLMSILRGGLN